jgi:hypothetical protein
MEFCQSVGNSRLVLPEEPFLTGAFSGLAGLAPDPVVSDDSDITEVVARDVDACARKTDMEWLTKYAGCGDTRRMR